MFPYRDENPTIRMPLVTYTIVAINLLVWALIQGFGMQPSLARSVCELGLIPGEFLGRLPAGTVSPLGDHLACVIQGAPAWYAPLTSMFLHGSWFHLLGNMWFLIVFGRGVEDTMRPLRFAAFYLLAGLAAVVAQVSMDPSSPVPLVGASGAISGVMGAYVMLFPTVRVHTLVFLGILVTRVSLPAFIMIGYWFLLQLLGATVTTSQGGVAFSAHVGGFVAGALLVRWFRDPVLLAQHRRAAYLYY